MATGALRAVAASAPRPRFPEERVTPCMSAPDNPCPLFPAVPTPHDPFVACALNGRLDDQHNRPREVSPGWASGQWPGVVRIRTIGTGPRGS